MTPEQYDRLPKYAQEEIARLNRLLDRAKTSLEEVEKEREGNGQPTGMFWQVGLDDVQHWIPKWATVHCPIGPQWADAIRLSRDTHGTIEVSTPKGILLIEASSSNRIKLHRTDG